MNKLHANGTRVVLVTDGGYGGLFKPGQEGTITDNHDGRLGSNNGFVYMVAVDDALDELNFFQHEIQAIEDPNQALVDMIVQQTGLTQEELISTGITASIRVLQEIVYEGNVEAGWWKNIVTGEAHPKGDVTLILSKLALVHSEVSEALEGVRKNLMDDKLPHRKMIEVELADAVIRILDLCGHEGLDLAGAIMEKLEYNRTREDHKVENRLKDGGKQA